MGGLLANHQAWLDPLARTPQQVAYQSRTQIGQWTTVEGCCYEAPATALWWMLDTHPAIRYQNIDENGVLSTVERKRTGDFYLLADGWVRASVTDGSPYVAGWERVKWRSEMNRWLCGGLGVPSLLQTYGAAPDAFAISAAPFVAGARTLLRVVIRPTLGVQTVSIGPTPRFRLGTQRVAWSEVVVEPGRFTPLTEVLFGSDGRPVATSAFHDYTRTELGSLVPQRIETRIGEARVVARYRMTDTGIWLLRSAVWADADIKCDVVVSPWDAATLRPESSADFRNVSDIIANAAKRSAEGRTIARAVWEKSMGWVRGVRWRDQAVAGDTALPLARRGIALVKHDDGAPDSSVVVQLGLVDMLDPAAYDRSHPLLLPDFMEGRYPSQLRAPPDDDAVFLQSAFGSPMALCRVLSRTASRECCPYEIDWDWGVMRIDRASLRPEVLALFPSSHRGERRFEPVLVAQFLDWQQEGDSGRVYPKRIHVEWPAWDLRYELEIGFDGTDFHLSSLKHLEPS
ncbi:MAG TPA: hypothetical protein DGT21_13340 [Armatimonadetes bacterium]|nr:hypothetical protein [Armatimonadota bacterium]